MLGAAAFLSSVLAQQEPGSPPVEELPPIQLNQLVPSLSFSNPFSRYANGAIPGWQYGGVATLSNDYVQLTPAAPNTIGWIWSDTAYEMPTWEVELEFHIGGVDTRGAGGGLAFWFTSSQGRNGPIYGQEDTYRGLGIFFDTFDGTKEEDGEVEPFVVAMMNYGEALAQGDDPDYFKNQAAPSPWEVGSGLAGTA